MRLTVFKNTVLLCVLIGISCGSKSKSDAVRENKIINQVQDDTALIVGANQTELYLPLLMNFHTVKESWFLIKK